MSATSDALIKSIKYRFDHDSAKQVLKEKYEAKMLFAINGGMWRAGPELIVLLRAINTNEAVITDTYGNPCRVNVESLLEEATQRWQEQMNAWEDEFQQLSRAR